MKTLLLVEDDKMLQEIITEFFSRRDYSVFVCEDEEKTMDILQKDHIDLIFLDVMLPDTDGFTLCRRIRKIYSCPIIFLTARVSEKDKLTGYSQDTLLLMLTEMKYREASIIWTSGRQTG